MPAEVKSSVICASAPPVMRTVTGISGPIPAKTSEPVTAPSGIFTTNLLESVKAFNEEYLLVSEALSFAYQTTIDEAEKHGEKQTPDYFMPKFRSSQQLIFAINDKHTRSL